MLRFYWLLNLPSSLPLPAPRPIRGYCHYTPACHGGITADVWSRPHEVLRWPGDTASPSLTRHPRAGNTDGVGRDLLTSCLKGISVLFSFFSFCFYLSLLLCSLFFFYFRWWMLLLMALFMLLLVSKVVVAVEVIVRSEFESPISLFSRTYVKKTLLGVTFSSCARASSCPVPGRGGKRNTKED